MRFRWRRGFLAAFGLVLLAGCVATGSPPQHVPPPASAVAAPARGIAQERLGRLGEVMQAYVDQGRLAGAVVVVHRDGREVYARAFGFRDREAGDPMREDAIFRIASQTKALVGVAAMMLMEEGRLLLDDPLGKHLPEWSQTTVAVTRPDGGFDVVPARRPITLRDLLTHTAGIAYGYGPGNESWREAGFGSWYFADRTEPMAALVARMAALPMAAQPGERFVYGYATDVLGVVIERVSGQRLDAFLDQRLLQPLGMIDSHFYLPAEKADRLAAVYAARIDGIERAPAPGEEGGSGPTGQGDYLDGPRVALSGGAGLLSTARDYARFLEMLRRGGELDGRRYLSRKSVELMTADHLAGVSYPTPGAGFGLGFQVVTDLGAYGRPGSVGEYGWGGAYHSQYWVDPAEGLSVVYLTQLIPAGDIDDQGKLRALIYQALE